MATHPFAASFLTSLLALSLLTIPAAGAPQMQLQPQSGGGGQCSSPRTGAGGSGNGGQGESGQYQQLDPPSQQYNQPSEQYNPSSGQYPPPNYNGGGSGGGNGGGGGQQGTTTLYWDCCKPSCAWPGKSTLVTNPVKTCGLDDQPLQDANAQSGCGGGGQAFMCSDQSPWEDPNDPSHAYGFAAANLPGQGEADWCCTCYDLKFTTTSIAGKTLTVQITNTGNDLADGQFDLAMPGGGVGQFTGGCSTQWNSGGSDSGSGSGSGSGGGGGSPFGQQYGGIDSGDACSALPAQWQCGCGFRFGWFEGADNPQVTYQRVPCPQELVQLTGCQRTDDGQQGSGGGGGGGY
ncbi:RlpA-like double-psi beta-barrel-protein domain-containing protein-containing protein [Macrophomina phaseolina]|uniref:cellulase n=1 Tax=Macrophomina phaseolina TaxID=35725 RepID=A0ABQ8G321_9PEZI|nr:RlpA-like double-psi beta-barrel-protein domain-containing protein-containing protein [Macrophomina phaseolina]